MTDDDVHAGVEGGDVVPFPAGGATPPDPLDRYKKRKDGCPVVPLGQGDGRFWFLTPAGELRALEARGMTELGLLGLVAGDTRWFWECFPRKVKSVVVGYDPAAVAEWLMRECARAGLWNPDTPVRGPGVWRAGPLALDGLLVHCGDGLLLTGDARGAGAGVPVGAIRRQRAGMVRDGAVYPARPAIGSPARAPATVAAGRALLADLGLWNFADPAGAHLALGWIGASLLGGAPRWRAHVYVLAAFGAGKTWLAELCQAALGAMAHEAANNYTEAGLRQALTNEARAILLDEAESDEGHGRLKAVIELIRHMSSGRGARVMRGSAEGTARSFAVTGSAYLSSVLPGPLKPQDRSRITLIQLLPLATGPEAAGASARAEAAIVAARAASPALWARALAGWGRFVETFEAYRTALMDRDAAPREADQMATLLAGRDLLTEDAVPGEERIGAALELVKGVVADARDEARTGEGEECLARLLTSGSGVIRGGRERTIGEQILDAREPGASDVRRDLEAIGLKVRGGGYVDGRDHALFVANRHQGLARAFAGTRWADGGHVQALRYLIGALPTREAIRFAGVTCRATELPSIHLPEQENQTSNPESF